MFFFSEGVSWEHIELLLVIRGFGKLELYRLQPTTLGCCWLQIRRQLALLPLGIQWVL
jgi:hypothetical protein